MTSVTSITLTAADPDGSEAFYDAAFGLGGRLAVRASDAPTSGFRAFVLSLVVAQPATVDELVGTALQAGATTLKPVAKSLWGYGGVVQAPDGAIWKVATSAKKNTGPATRDIDDIVLLIGAQDVPASKRFYVEHGLTVKRSFARAYVEFDAPARDIKLALYKRKALAKDAGVSVDGTGSHGIVIGGDSESFTDPDGFAWEPTAAARRRSATLARALTQPA